MNSKKPSTVLLPPGSWGIFSVSEVKERMDKNSSCVASNDETVPTDLEANLNPPWRQKAENNI